MSEANGALIHPAGVCALPGALRPLAAMGRYTPQTPSEPHGTEHPLRRLFRSMRPNIPHPKGGGQP